MKTFISRSKIIAIAFALTFSAASAESFANNKTDNPVELKYLGSVNSQPVFLLNLNNNESDEFVVTLKDRAGNVLYSETLKGKLVSKKYRLDTDDSASEIRFEVSSKKDNTKTVYTVVRNTHVVEDVAINKL